MNFKITHNWLKEYVDTDATPQEIQDYLSLSAVNVETLEKVGDDWVYDIEITSNRIDAASVLGFAMECVAVLPRHGKKATFKQTPLSEKTFTGLQTPGKRAFTITVKDTDAVSRVAAVVMSDVKIGQTPGLIKKRLEAVGERSINNVVDISNYLRIAYGQPVHTFDFDQIKKAHMSIEKSASGDIVTLIDGTELKLPGDDVIIKDGEDRIIDLVGLMGGQNTEVSDTTKNVLFFIPVVNKRLVRKTSMTTGHRTAAISYFEKAPDEERVEATLVYGIELLKEHAGAVIGSDIFDHYPKPYKGKTVDVHVSYLSQIINAELTADQVINMLKPLGFEAKKKKDDVLRISVPSYRAKDIAKPVDIAEEVARIYGYYNIPSVIQQTDVVYQPLDAHALIQTREAVRDYLVPLGYHEQYNYSMISQDVIEACGLHVEHHLKLTDSISREIEYMRMSLVPSLLANCVLNTGFITDMQFFEAARTYGKIPLEGELPEEVDSLGFISNKGYRHLKGVIEALSEYLRVDLSFKTDTKVPFLGAHAAAIYLGGERAGYIGDVSKKTLHNLGLNGDYACAEFNLNLFTEARAKQPTYEKPHQFAQIKRDFTYTATAENPFVELEKKTMSTTPLLQSIELIDMFKNKATLRCTYADPKKNITEKDVEKVHGEVEKVFG